MCNINTNTVKCLGCMSTAGTGELRFIEGNMDSNMYCDILKQMMMPSLQKLFSNITTPNTPTRWQLPCCWRWRWRWWSGQVCLQTWTLLITCGASSSRRWRSTMCLTSIELYLEDSKFLLLYKLHIDYSKMYPSLFCLNVRGILTFERYIVCVCVCVCVRVCVCV